jgi:simple sugar transport system ATP-binding protein
MAAMMIGDQPIAALDSRAPVPDGAHSILMVKQLKAPDRTGLKTIDIGELDVKSGEIVGIAGISGNGQKEFLEVLAGQRRRDGGTVLIKGSPYGASRSEARVLNVRFIPEEPLRNACAPKMTVAENMAFRTFDVGESGKPVSWINMGTIRAYAARLVEQFKVKTASLASPIQALSGGNVQRAVLARELTGEVDLLIVSNPCFGLDFSAVAEIRARIMKARNAGTAVLLMSEDLDELLELSDRILVMSDGKLVYETPIAAANVHRIGEHMAGHH